MNSWERLGADDPYYGVLTEDRYRGGQTRASFFASGEEHIQDVFATVRRTIDPAFNPARALDFGCGVGRLLIPLADRCERVVGVDVSASMLAEAAKNAGDFANVELVGSDDDLSKTSGTFDFIHSFIVFQHMPVSSGMRVLDAMLRLLDPGGVGALHFTYARDIGFFHRAALGALHVIPGLYVLLNIAQRRPLRTPLMEMHDYDLGLIAGTLQSAGCTDLHAELTDHYGHRGALVFFKKP
jgi:SAM-dependent methyltransferase